MSADDRRQTRVQDTEKITLNLGHVDLGRIDLLVRDGYFTNRADLIRTAVRNHLDRHDDALKKAVARNGLELGLRHYGRRELEAAVQAGVPLDIRVVGLASIASDVTPELARASIASLHVLGTLQAAPDVRAALRDRTM